jgi:hypothetical protein
MQPNKKLIEAILALQAIEEGGLYGGSYSDKDSVKRCQRILDALVPPPKQGNGKEGGGS